MAYQAFCDLAPAHHSASPPSHSLFQPLQPACHSQSLAVVLALTVFSLSSMQLPCFEDAYSSLCQILAPSSPPNSHMVFMYQLNRSLLESFLTITIQTHIPQSLTHPTRSRPELCAYFCIGTYLSTSWSQTLERELLQDRDPPLVASRMLCMVSGKSL